MYLPGEVHHSPRALPQFDPSKWPTRPLAVPTTCRTAPGRAAQGTLSAARDAYRAVSSGEKTIALATPRRDVAPAPSPQNENSASALRKTHFGPRVPKLGFVARIWPGYAERLDLHHFPRQRFPGAPEVFNFRKCRNRHLGRGSPGALRRDWILSRKGRLRSSMHSVTPDRSRAKNKSARHRVAAAR